MPITAKPSSESGTNVGTVKQIGKALRFRQDQLENTWKSDEDGFSLARRSIEIRQSLQAKVWRHPDHIQCSSASRCMKDRNLSALAAVTHLGARVVFADNCANGEAKRPTSRCVRRTAKEQHNKRT